MDCPFPECLIGYLPPAPLRELLVRGACPVVVLRVPKLRSFSRTYLLPLFGGAQGLAAPPPGQHVAADSEDEDMRLVSHITLSDVQQALGIGIAAYFIARSNKEKPKCGNYVGRQASMRADGLETY